MTETFKKTLKQVEATRIMAGPARHVMLYGGSRSGKTLQICRANVIRAAKTKSRHLITRLRFNHAKRSIWLDTMPKVLNMCFPGLPVKEDKTDHFYKFPNGSEIWIGGLDDKQRTEKILGMEFSTITFNECSQIPLTSINMALTRLAEKNELKKKVYYDMNPPTKKHWSYARFILNVNPDTWEPDDLEHNYAYVHMNPRDNLENIDDSYLDILQSLSEKDRQRFLDGLFTDEDEGNIYYSFDRERHVLPQSRRKDLPLEFGMDFNVNPMTAIVYQIWGRKIHVLKEIYLKNSNTYQMGEHINEAYPGRWVVIPDSTGRALKTSAKSGKSDHQILRDHNLIIPSVHNPYRGDRYNCVNGLFQQDRIEIDPSCVKLIKDLNMHAYKEGTNLPDETDKTLGHITDALGYPCWYHFPILRPTSGVMNVPR